ncbi:MAG: NAD(P)-dependent glycerol-3-phosphate dehydrogenase [Eggerthellaceae bacterium]|nr:NAD(P)-dependent glycerol-3-phosphate dehydrogenase [Eggerthellaceae bacterium]
MKVSVIGTGSWGTALAEVLGRAGHSVRIWGRTTCVCDGINSEHKNPRYLNDHTLSENIVASTVFTEVVQDTQAVVVVTPSQAMEHIATTLAEFVSHDVPIIICTKGVEASSGRLPIEVFSKIMGNRSRFAALSGPNHAEEVVKGLPSGTVIASEEESTAKFFQQLFAAPTLRCYTSSDVIGVEVCAAYKNVVAIAVGASYGLGFGDNTAALLMTRGLAEMSRLVEACGGDKLTCLGLAGVGDLEVTCMSRHSRNRTFGERLAAGTTLEQYKQETHMVVEGAQACASLRTLGERYHVELPIADVVYDIVWHDGNVGEVASRLLGRPQHDEF